MSPSEKESRRRRKRGVRTASARSRAGVISRRAVPEGPGAPAQGGAERTADTPSRQPTPGHERGLEFRIEVTVPLREAAKRKRATPTCGIGGGTIAGRSG